MKLRKVLTKGKEHYSYMITIPKALIEAKNWNDNDRLKAEFDKNGDIVLKKE